jgi:uncharacterized protein with HEPN domain
MPRDLAAYLQDILDATYAINDVMRGVSLEHYRATRSIRSSVEREFIIIGEALRRISTLDEELFVSISNSRAIIDFRNLLTHDYGAIDDDSVFGVVYSDLIILQAEVVEFLQQQTSTNPNGSAPDPPV